MDGGLDSVVSVPGTIGISTSAAFVNFQHVGRHYIGNVQTKWHDERDIHGLCRYVASAGGGSTSQVDGAAVTSRRPRRILRRSTEKTNPFNAEFELQVAIVQARQQEQERQRQISALLGSLGYAIYSQTGEDGQSQSQTNVLELYANSSTSLFIKAFANQDKGHHRLINSATPPDPAEFLEGTFIKMSSDKQKANTRNKKNRKNKKKKKVKPRKRSPAASKMQSEPAIGPSSTCANVARAEDMFIQVAVDVPQLEYSSSSSSSPVTELVSHVSAAASSDKELSSSSNDFRSCNSTSYYSASAGSSVNGHHTGDNAWNNTLGDYGGTLSDARSERSWSALELTNSRCFSKTGGERNKPNDLQSFSSPAISPGCGQKGLLCSDANDDGGFQKVISRKAAQKMKRMQRLRSPTQTMVASVPITTSALVPRARCEIIIGHYIKDDCFSGRKKNHKKGKCHKGWSLTNVPKKRFTGGGENVPGSSKMLLTSVKPVKPGSSQMTPSSAPLHRHVALEAIQETCSSVLLPMQGELKPVVAPVDGDTEQTDSRAPSSSNIASSSDHLLNNAARVHRAEHKTEENEKTSIMDASEWEKIVKAANNDAHKIQCASDVLYMVSGHADIETFLHSATPVIGQTSNSSLQGQQLWSVWKWYEEPESFGIEVEMQRSFSPSISGICSMPELSTYFVPSLSAVQLFGQSEKPGSKFRTWEESCLISSNHGLLFEYFELERPFMRPPLFTKIKQLVSGVNLFGNPIVGDPKQLECAKLSDLHPASWFCVAWYPICQIPTAAGSCQTAFLTYHSLGKLVPQTCSIDMANGFAQIICPIVGLLSYKHEGENWFQLGGQSGSKLSPDDSSKKHPIELLDKRLSTLRHGASVMSKAVVPKASGEAMNNHPDYEFFRSRSL